MKTILIAIVSALALAVPAFAQDATVKDWPVFAVSGAPSNGTNEVDTLTIQSSTSGGTFTITVAGGRTTAPIAWSATNATLLANINAALAAISNIGTGGATATAGTLTAGIGTVLITFSGTNSAATDVPALSIGTNSLTGGAAPTLTTTTPGVAATFRTARPGTILVDSTTPALYFNTSATQGAPTWTAVTIP